METGTVFTMKLTSYSAHEMKIIIRQMSRYCGTGKIIAHSANANLFKYMVHVLYHKKKST